MGPVVTGPIIVTTGEAGPDGLCFPKNYPSQFFPYFYGFFIPGLMTISELIDLFVPPELSHDGPFMVPSFLVGVPLPYSWSVD